MVGHHRVAPTITVQPVRGQSGPTSFSRVNRFANSDGLRKRQKQFLTLVAIASTLAVAAAIGAIVLIWLTLGSILAGKTPNNSSSDAQSSGPTFHWLNDNSTQPFLLGRTIVDHVEVPGPTTKKMSADSRSNFPPCTNTNQIQCRSDGKCIPVTLHCNKVKDCTDGSDEYNCTCLDVLRRTSPNKLCDGYADCPSEEDENDCAYQCHNTSGLQQTFRCTASGQCIPQSALCDGKRDCIDGQDENECWMLAPNFDATIPLNSRIYYDFGYVFRRQRGIWYAVSTVEEPAKLGQLMCQQVHYKSVIYAALRTMTDNRVNGCYVATGNQQAASNLEFSSSCPNKMALYLACDELICGNLPDCRPARKRVVGGTGTGPMCNPWTVALYRDGEMSCQAVILNNLWLITAAHCFKNSEMRRWTARLGMYRQSSWSPSVLVRNIVSVIRHENFTDNSVETNDIALIRLDRPVTFSATVQPPCMATKGDNPQDGDICTVYGWGYMVEDGLQFSDELRQVDLSVISNERCNSSPAFFYGHVSDGHLCLGHGTERKDACQGDSGGPLLCARGVSRSHYLAGITSTGDGCGRPNTPGVWTRLSHYIDWISRTIALSSVQLSALSTAVGPDRPCAGYQCGTGECVYGFYRCDGGWDCQVDGSDELYCSRDIAEDNIVPAQGTTSTVAAANGPATVPTSRCGDENYDGFLCSDGVTCLPYYQRCDYVLDCPSGDDEKNCFYCLDSDIPCNDARRCLPFSMVVTSFSNETYNRWLRDRFDCRTS